MEIYIGENIKRLRKERSMTQESLAGILQISPQSVSKWERAEAYPDITMLPAIANCFGITVDVLLGNDKILTEQRIQNYIDEYKRMTSELEWKYHESVLDFAKKAYQEFPFDFRIMMLYVNALNIYETEPDKQDEITRICKLVLQNCENCTLCMDASSYICGLRSAEDRMAFLEKYIEYGQDWNWFKVYPYDSEEGKILMQHEIADKWWHLNMYIYTYGNFFDDNPGYHVSHKDKIKLIRKCEMIFYAFFDEDDLGEYVFYVGQYNEFLAREYAALGQVGEALLCFEKSVDGWIAYSTLPEQYTYRNILIDHRPYVKAKLDGPYTILPRYKDEIDRNPVYDILRGEERFKAAYEKLTSV